MNCKQIIIKLLTSDGNTSIGYAVQNIGLIMVYDLF